MTRRSRRGCIRTIRSLRAINRAWTDYVPTFAEHVTGIAYADDEADYNAAAAKIPVAFERLERALEKQGAGPFFNGAKYSLVDAAYAPFLQRYFFLDRIKRIGVIEKFPRLKAWAEALIKRPSTHSFPEAEFEAMYRGERKTPKKMGIAVHCRCGRCRRVGRRIASRSTSSRSICHR